MKQHVSCFDPFERRAVQLETLPYESTGQAAVPNYSAELDTNTTETPTFSAELDTHETDLPNAESDTVPLDHESKVESNAVFSSSSTINVSQTMIILFAISLIFS
jgi:hypothetical protein